MNYKCTVKCYFRARVWKPGETLASIPGEVIPKHFKSLANVKEEIKKPVEEPKTLKALHENEVKNSTNFSSRSKKKEEEFLE